MRTGKTARLISLSVALVTVFALTGCQYILPKEEAPLAPPLIESKDVTYTTVEVKKGDVVQSVQGVGRFQSAQSANVYYALNDGRVKSIKVRIGDTVKKGDVLMELETGALDYELQIAKMRLEIDENNFKEAKKHLRKTALRNAEIAIEISRLGVKQLEDKKSSSVLRAPIDGSVVDVTTQQIGSAVTAFDTLVRITDDSNKMLTYMDENNRSAFQIGMKVQVTMNKSGDKCEGEVVSTPFERTEANKDIVDKTVYIKVPDDFLKKVEVGEDARIVLILAEKKDVLVLPKNAVKTFQQREYVQVLENGVKVEKDVKVGLDTGTQCEILDGVKQGDKVIIR